MRFDVLVLIDCWEENIWEDQAQRNKMSSFYDRIIKFVSDYNFKKVIFATHGYRYSNPTSERLVRGISNSSNTLMSKTQVQNFYELYAAGVKPGDTLLVGGAAWNVCVHHNQIGLINLVQEEHFSVLTHPDILDSLITKNEKITAKTLQADEKIRWNSADQKGFMVASYAINKEKR